MEQPRARFGCARERGFYMALAIWPMANHLALQMSYEVSHASAQHETLALLNPQCSAIAGVSAQALLFRSRFDCTATALMASNPVEIGYVGLGSMGSGTHASQLRHDIPPALISASVCVDGICSKQ